MKWITQTGWSLVVLPIFTTRHHLHPHPQTSNPTPSSETYPPSSGVERHVILERRRLSCGQFQAQQSPQGACFGSPPQKRCLKLVDFYCRLIPLRILRVSTELTGSGQKDM